VVRSRYDAHSVEFNFDSTKFKALGGGAADIEEKRLVRLDVVDPAQPRVNEPSPRLWM